MSERADLIIQQIIDLEQRKANLAFIAMEAERVGDDALADQCDEWWAKADDEIGPLQDRLWKIVEDEALREREAELDREYGAWATFAGRALSFFTGLMLALAAYGFVAPL